jgi:plasmid stabilization system protein ParE
VRLHFHPAAFEELEAAAAWYEANRQGLGDEFFRAVTDALDLLRPYPEAGKASGETRQLTLSRFPFRIVYRLGNGGIVIVAIAHTKRRPGYWRERR